MLSARSLSSVTIGSEVSGCTVGVGRFEEAMPPCYAAYPRTAPWSRAPGLRAPLRSVEA